ncbi:hypothetical protein [Stutzerimonas nitrititolerans]|uniref:hypothetical protein n=1 Tax=Stutzerimonas nitrititolerans TaxID=2482751 RepID=UPI0028AA84DD|nr:hypothetical protein [Stutzerimonas nitrititolerans]
MGDPLDKAVAKAPPTIGSGCTQRYDLDFLGPEDGTEFPDAELLWRRMQRADEEGSRADDTSNEP